MQRSILFTITTETNSCWHDRSSASKPTGVWSMRGGQGVTLNQISSWLDRRPEFEGAPFMSSIANHAVIFMISQQWWHVASCPKDFWGYQSKSTEDIETHWKSLTLTVIVCQHLSWSLQGRLLTCDVSLGVWLLAGQWCYFNLFGADTKPSTSYSCSSNRSNQSSVFSCVAMEAINSLNAFFRSFWCGLASCLPLHE